MPTTARSRSYPRSLLRHHGIRLTTAAELAANPISNPATDPRVHTSARIAEIFERSDGRTLELWFGELLCMRESLQVPADGGLICHGNSAIVGVGPAEEPIKGIVLGEPGVHAGFDSGAFEPRYSRLRFIRHTQSDWSDPVNDIGIQIWNAHTAKIDIVGSANSACCLEFATDVSTGYSQFGIGYMNNGQTGIRLKNYALLRPDGGDVYTNNNHFQALSGGRVSVDSAIHSGLSRMGIHFTRGGPSDSESMDANTFAGFTFELQGAGSSESLIALHDCGKWCSLLDYWDETNTLTFRWTGNTRGHTYSPKRNDIRSIRGEYLGYYAGANRARRDRAYVSLGSRWESVDWSLVGNHCISRQTLNSDSLWMKGACQIRSSAGLISPVESTSGVADYYSLARGYLKPGDGSRAFGVILQTRHAKEFFLQRDSDPTVNSGGRFIVRPFDVSGNLIGCRTPVSGGFTSVSDSGGFAQFTHNAHAVAVNDIVEISGSSVAEYDRDQAPIAIASMSVSGGQMVLTAAAAHKLQPGDWIHVFRNSVTSHTGFHRVLSTPTALTAVLDSQLSGSSTGGYFTARRYHRVTAVDANTFTTHRAYAGNATGGYATGLPIKQADSGVTVFATTSWGGAIVLGGSDHPEPKTIHVHQFADYCLIGLINCAIRKLTIVGLEDLPISVSPGHNFDPELVLGWSAPTAGNWGKANRVVNYARTFGTGSIVTGWSCGTSGTPGTWQAITEALS